MEGPQGSSWTRLRWSFDRLRGSPAPQRKQLLAIERARDPELAERLGEMLAHVTEDGYFDPGVLVEFIDAARRPSPPPSVLAGRYELGATIGRGGQGAVLAARDLLTRRDVAVKLLDPAATDPMRTRRREVATLRRVRTPGVVSLLDDGEEDGQSYIVMELVAGAAFPGVDVSRSWAAVAPRARDLMEAVAGIHRLGIVHGDLKPANVLVGHDGSVRIVDLGIAVDTRTDGAGAPSCGTPAYMAPEQFGGAEPSQSSDLYAVGLLLFEALAGCRPQEADTLDELIHLRSHCPAPRLEEFCPDLPIRVGATVSQLLSRDPLDRPESAAVAWREMCGAAASPFEISSLAGLPLDGTHSPRTEAELRELFHGPDRVLEIPSRGARLLWQESGGDALSVMRTVDRWVRGGDAVVRDGRIDVTDLALDRLEVAIAPAYRELIERISEGRLRAAVDAAVRWATRSISDGHAGRATGILQEALAIERRLDRSDPGRELELLLLIANAALIVGTSRALDVCLYELARARCHSHDVAALRSVVELAHLAVQGRAERALPRLRELSFPAEGPLERLRLTCVEFTARRVPRASQEAALRELASTLRRSGDPVARAMLAGALGWRQYVRGRFRAAGRLHMIAYTHSPQSIRRITALTDAASAFMEARDLDRAGDLVRAADTLLSTRQPLQLRLRVAWLHRTLAYRHGRAGPADGELVRAARTAGVAYLQAFITLNEAAVAWRRGAHSTCSRFAQEAAAAAASAGHRLVQDLALALAWRAGDEYPERADMWARAKESAIPGLSLQAVALAHGGCLGPCECARLADELHARTQPVDRFAVREVLSIDEALELVHTRTAMVSVPCRLSEFTKGGIMSDRKDSVVTDTWIAVGQDLLELEPPASPGVGTPNYVMMAAVNIIVDAATGQQTQFWYQEPGTWNPPGVSNPHQNLQFEPVAAADVQAFVATIPLVDEHVVTPLADGSGCPPLGADEPPLAVAATELARNLREMDRGWFGVFGAWASSQPFIGSVEVSSVPVMGVSRGEQVWTQTSYFPSLADLTAPLHVQFMYSGVPDGHLTFPGPIVRNTHCVTRLPNPNYVGDDGPTENQ